MAVSTASRCSGLQGARGTYSCGVGGDTAALIPAPALLLTVLQCEAARGQLQGSQGGKCPVGKENK